jgi:hypothetical protein
MLENGIIDKKQKKFFIKNKKQMRELKRIFDWVEEITIKLRLDIITSKNLQNTGDIQYLNQWVRYEELRALVEEIIDNVLDTEDKNIDILDKIKEFRKNS